MKRVVARVSSNRRPLTTSTCLFAKIAFPLQIQHNNHLGSSSGNVSTSRIGAGDCDGSVGENCDHILFAKSSSGTPTLFFATLFRPFRSPMMHAMGNVLRSLAFNWELNVVCFNSTL